MKMCDKCKSFIGTYNYCPMCGNYIGKNEYGKVESPTITKDKHSVRTDEYTESHPSYAQLLFSRRSCSKDDTSTLYGSAIRHQNIITMTVYKSAKHVSDYNESYYAEISPYIEVEMSQSQFSEAITSMNMGMGVPVTLRSLMGKVYPNCTELTIQEQTQKKLNNRMRLFTEELKTKSELVDDIINKKGTLTISEKKQLSSVIHGIITEVKSNLPFLNECMQEALDKNTTAAKADIEAFFLTAITKLGLNSLKDQKELVFDNHEQMKRLEK